MHAAILFFKFAFSQNQTSGFEPAPSSTTQRQRVEHGIHYTRYFWREKRHKITPKNSNFGRWPDSQVSLAARPTYAPVTLTLPIIPSYPNFNIKMSQNFHFFRILGNVDKLLYELFSDIPTLYVPVTLTLPIIPSYTKLSTQISQNV